MMCARVSSTSCAGYGALLCRLRKCVLCDEGLRERKHDDCYLAYFLAGGAATACAALPAVAPRAVFADARRRWDHV